MIFTVKSILAALVSAAVTMAAPAPKAAPAAEPAPEPTGHERPYRTDAQIWTSGACDSQPVYSGTYSSGGCLDFPNGGGKYGVKFQDSAGCKYKMWESQNCKGKATVHTQNGNSYIPIANTRRFGKVCDDGGSCV